MTLTSSGLGEYDQPESLIVVLPFLEGLPQEDWLDIFQSFEVKKGQPGDTLYEQDAELESVYVLVEGAVRQKRVELTESGAQEVHYREVTQQLGEPGTILCVYDLLFGDTYGTTTTVVRNSSPSVGDSNECTVLVFDSAAINRLIFRSPQIRRRLAPLDLVRRLRTIPMIGHVPLILLGFLADATTTTMVAGDAYIYTEGELPDKVFFVDQGQVRLDWIDGKVNWAANGAAFGLVEPDDPEDPSRRRNRAMRHAAVATSEVTVLSVPYDQFRDITCLDPDVTGTANMRNRHQIITGLPVFSKLSKEQQNRLVGFFSHYYFPISQLLVQQGEEADSLWIMVQGGQAAIQALDGTGRKLTSTISLGDTHFCETALMGQVTQESSVEAMAGSEWLRLHWTDFQHFDDGETTEIREILEVPPERRKTVADERQRKKFAWLQPGELLVLQSRRHWIAFLQKGIPFVLFLFLLLGLIYLTVRVDGAAWFFAVLIGIVAIITFASFAWAAVDYFNDWIMVTTRRVVRQETVLLISTTRQEAPIDQIQQVGQFQGFIGKMLNYGTTDIHTASTTGVIWFEYTRNFEELNQAIEAQREQQRLHSAAESKTQISNILADRLGHRLSLPSRVFATLQVDVEGKKRRHINLRFRNASGQEKGNRVVWRKHWIALIPKLWWALLTLLAMFVLTALSVLYAGAFSETVRPLGRIAELALSILTLIALGKVIWVIINWYNDTYEVDDESLTHIEQLPFGLLRRQSDAPLAMIQNVTTDIPTPIHWLFNFGTVHCQTAAEEGDFPFNSVPAPRIVAAEIQWRMAEIRRRDDERERDARAREFPDWLEIYHKLETDDMPL